MEPRRSESLCIIALFLLLSATDARILHEELRFDDESTRSGINPLRDTPVDEAYGHLTAPFSRQPPIGSPVNTPPFTVTFPFLSPLPPPTTTLPPTGSGMPPSSAPTSQPLPPLSPYPTLSPKSPPMGLTPSPVIVHSPPKPVSSPPHYAVWCVAKLTVPDPIVQVAMDYACGSGVDCQPIKPNGPCFQPNTVLAHASYAFNSYWQKNKLVGATCDFGGSAMLVPADPSYDKCHFVSK